MSMNLKAFFSGPAWVDVTVPEWFKERVDAIAKTLGDDHADLALFKEILAEGKVTEDAAMRADALAGTTQAPEVFLLATDIGLHAFTVLQMITQVVPVERPKQAA